ncbi:MAG: flagellar hook assembly protein FlgD [Calditrichia bacterium]
MEITNALQSAGVGGNQSVFQDSLGGEEFLQLLVAQLQNQDPLSPMESQEFAAELAQFSSLEKLASIDDTLAESVSTDIVLTQAINNTLASTLLGQEVTAVGNTFALSPGEDTDLTFRLGDYAESVDVVIYDGSGNEVRRIDAGSMNSGEHTIDWDGKGQDGREMLAGDYSFQVEATSATGDPVSAMTLIRGAISSIRYENGAAVLIINGGEIAFSNVLEIATAP